MEFTIFRPLLQTGRAAFVVTGAVAGKHWPAYCSELCANLLADKVRNFGNSVTKMYMTKGITKPVLFYVRCCQMSININVIAIHASVAIKPHLS